MIERRSMIMRDMKIYDSEKYDRMKIYDSESMTEQRYTIANGECDRVKIYNSKMLM